MTLLFVRVIKGLFSFVIIASLRPYEKAKTTKLELINELILIFLVDCIVVQTGILTTGNVDDMNRGNTPDIQRSS